VRYAIVGGTGVIGSALTEELRLEGHEVVIVTRRGDAIRDAIRWDPKRGFSNCEKMERLDAVFHLGGAPLAARPWTRRRRQVLRDSRIQSTAALLQGLGDLKVAPQSFIGVSATGYYGDCGERVVDEDDDVGEGFLASLAHSWEQAHLGATEIGCRVAVLRLSPVLAPHGGPFPLLLRPFRVMPGWVGNGRHWNGWISSRDCVSALRHLANPELGCEGVYNGSVPEAVRNRDWCEALGRVLSRKVYTHAPKWVIRGAFGDLAKELLLASIRVAPRRLLESGYSFRDTEAEPTFRWLVDSIARSGRGVS
jgi:uncharacterized protein (TIGR01777 family)